MSSFVYQQLVENIKRGSALVRSVYAADVSFERSKCKFVDMMVGEMYKGHPNHSGRPTFEFRLQCVADFLVSRCLQIC